MGGAQPKEWVSNGLDGGWRQVLGARDLECVLLVLVIGWISAAATLVYHGKFNLILLLITVGFMTSLVVLSSGLSLISAFAVRKLSSRNRL